MIYCHFIHYRPPKIRKALKSVGRTGQSVRRDGRHGGAFVCVTVPRVAPPRAVVPALVSVRIAPPPRPRRRPSPRRPPVRRPPPPLG